MIHLWTVETTTVMAVEETTSTETVVTASRVYSMVEIMAGEELNDVAESEKGVMAHVVEDIMGLTFSVSSDCSGFSWK